MDISSPLKRRFADARHRFPDPSGLLYLELVALSAFSLAKLVRTVGSGTIWVFSAALLQMIVPDQFRGRVFAFEFAALTLTQSISIFWAGYAQDTIGLSVRQISFTMALVAAIVGLAWLIFNARYRTRPMVSPDA